MRIDLQLYNEISKLPANLKQEVYDFVKLLKQKDNVKAKIKLKERKPGIAKGMIEMAPDFDEPLEDFKSYM